MDQGSALNPSPDDGQLEPSTTMHPYPATVIAFIFILIVVSLFISILRQLLERRLSQRRGWFLNTTYPPPSPAASSSGGSSRRSKKVKEQKTRPISECEIESRQLLFSDAADRAERGSLYDTFQLPGPHASKLKPARSMMELNGGSPLEGAEEKEGQKKAKTIHWHGVNRLNTAWGWMS
ncbi:hypothetical protein FPSE_00920 [Fusarium pseudograminearum CS3096]|uniref:Uncharacterized protein n=1 Tax=Fusarium pseudograminearum (strain CS3096) TaxID=1028729 RepID=K3VVZ8_FUSPC|nr:hypothetical protein FPSE_00920 [Fusarium pseudograminearum CS3096]EKJ78953.1 hypothetical protein FPSE_00920 [Fusarium pseudograminearum CS3096]KAF0639082.1 hypothetical protein FPSE5266_00920 [Fusarium pseudograminearum]